MAVVVQRMVEPDKAGVLFTVDPVQRRRDQMIVEAIRGLGEQVVSGEVTPDHYVVDRAGAVKRERPPERRRSRAEASSSSLAALGRGARGALRRAAGRRMGDRGAAASTCSSRGR